MIESAKAVPNYLLPSFQPLPQRQCDFLSMVVRLSLAISRPRLGHSLQQLTSYLIAIVRDSTFYHVTNTTETVFNHVFFSRDKHYRYGKISSVYVCSHSHRGQSSVYDNSC